MKKRIILLSLISILIAIISWITNFGFMRLYYTVVLIPIVHAVIVLAVGLFLTSFANQRRIRLYNLLFCATYVISNICYPDADEINQYVFFGLINNDILCNVGRFISVFALIMHVVLFVLQFIEVTRVRKN